MTRERAIKILERKTTIPGDDVSFSDIEEAIDMAIEALNAEPCEDAISREGTMKALCELPKTANAELAVCLDYADVMCTLLDKEKLPSVTPTGKMGD